MIQPASLIQMQTIVKFPVVRCRAVALSVSLGMLCAACAQRGLSVERSPLARAPERVLAGPVSHFDGTTVDATFGSGWSGSSDSSSGGGSRVVFALAPGGALNTRSALTITGTVDAGLPYAWAGVTFFPARERYAPTDFTAVDSLVFWSRGDGQRYRIMLLSEGADGSEIRTEVRFVALDMWVRMAIAMNQFRGASLRSVRGISVLAGPAPGPFRVMIDEVVLR